MQNSSLILCVAAALLAGCGSTVNGGGGTPDESTTSSASGGEGGSDPSTSSGIAGGNAGGASAGGSSVGGGSAVPAVAMTRARLDQLWDEYWETHDPSGSSSSTGGGPELDPNDLFLRVSDLGASCSEPTTDLSCGGHWEVSIALPQGYQTVGTYDLEDPALLLYGYMSETGTPNSPDPEDCPWGGGSIGPGSLEIVSIDATSVRFVLTLEPTFWSNDPSGEYVAPRCQ